MSIKNKVNFNFFNLPPKVARPTLIVNAEDDMVCLAENIREDIVAALPGAVLLR